MRERGIENEGERDRKWGREGLKMREKRGKMKYLHEFSRMRNYKDGPVNVRAWVWVWAWAWWYVILKHATIEL